MTVINCFSSCLTAFLVYLFLCEVLAISFILVEWITRGPIQIDGMLLLILGAPYIAPFSIVMTLIWSRAKHR